VLQDHYGQDLTTRSVAAADGVALACIALARTLQIMARGPEVQSPLERARTLAAGTGPREQSHVAIFERILTGQGAAALQLIPEHLKEWPRDAPAPATSVRSPDPPRQAEREES
jgi:hypothetical protein